MSLTLESRIQRLNEMVDEGLIIRNDWVGADEQGRETACLLAALSPEAAKAETASACPAEVMPGWFAHMTPWMDDHSSTAEWPRMIRRYAACANRWHTLDEAAWRRVEISARRAAVEEAMRHTSDEQVLVACRGVLDWLDADMPESSHAAVKEAVVAAKLASMEARAAATSWAESAEDEAKEAWRSWEASKEAEAWRAWAGAASAASPWALAAARAESAESAAEASHWALAAARAGSVAAAAAAAMSAAAVAKAEYEAADRIIDAVLSYLEKECGL